MSFSPPGRTRVFISYSHKDEMHLKRLHVHLDPFVRDQKIDVWDDNKLTPGVEWRKAIRQAIESAKIGILLISADFLASEFIAKNELPPLLEAAEKDGALIFSVILSPSSFNQTKLARYQTLNPPSKPLIGMSKVRQEELWTKLVQYVYDALSVQKPSDSVLDTVQPRSKTSATAPSADALPAMSSEPEMLLPSGSIEALIKEGRKLNTQQRFAEALFLFECAISDDRFKAAPLDVQGNAWFGKEEALRGLGRVSDALEAYRRATDLLPWIYDFYEKYNEAIAYRMPERQQYGPEMSGRIIKKALHAQPPHNDSGWYLYEVLLPEKIRRLELSFFIGIRDNVEIPIGASVRFKVKVDNVVVFSKDYDTHQWEHHVVTLKYESGGKIAISFETEIRGKWMGNGAMWGEPILKDIL